MEYLFQEYFPLAFPVFFVALWLLVGTIIGAMAGWYALMARFPDRNERPLLKLNWQWGSMGYGVRLRGVLKLAACPGGLRVGMFRLFGAFARDFFVPWDEITVRRSKWFGTPLAELRFGRPVVGRLTIHGHVADRLAEAASHEWREETSPA